ncbi:MAG: thiosulfate oxidation carrier protein SoxY [Magnetococcus sp. WYHC-3]
MPVAKLENPAELSRRGFFRSVGVTGAAVLVAGGGLMRPQSVQAGPVEDLIAKEMGAGAVGMGGVTLSTDAEASTADTVKIPFSASTPVTKVGLFVDNNPNPHIATFEVAPELGALKMEVRIRMAKTSPVRLVALTADGKLVGDTKSIEVKGGGCA